MKFSILDLLVLIFSVACFIMMLKMLPKEPPLNPLFIDMLKPFFFGLIASLGFTYVTRNIS